MATSYAKQFYTTLTDVILIAKGFSTDAIVMALRDSGISVPSSAFNEHWGHTVQMSEIRRFAAEARGGTPENDNRRMKDSVKRLQATVVEFNYTQNPRELRKMVYTCCEF